MANKIGIVLALDGEKEFTAAVQTAKKEVNMFQSELKGLSEKFDGQANSMEALTEKQKVLTQQQEAYQRKLDAAKSGCEKANENYRKMGDRLGDLKNDLEQARKELQKMDEGTDEYKKQAKAVEELEKAVEKQTIAHTRESGSIAEWNQRVRESQRELDKSNDEIEKNTRYLDEARSSADHCATSIDKMGREVKETGDDIDEAGKKSSTFGDVLKANLTADAIVAGVQKVGEAAKEAAEYVVDVGSSFEAAMSEVQAISGASGSDLDAMSEKAQELGASTKFTATEVANAFKYMSLAGWETSDMLSGIDGVLSLAAASGMELAQASDMVTDYLSAFGMEASESIKIADMLAFAQANSNTTAEQLGEAYGNCAANMHAAGQDIETTTSFLEAFANQGIKGSEAGTKMSAIMRDITAKMKDGKIAIGDTNVEVTDANGNFRDLTDIMTDVEAATEGMGDAERAAALASTFTSRSVGGLNMILNEGVGQISNYEESLRNAGGAADEAAAIMQDNLSGDLTKMNSALEGLGIAAFDYVDGPLRGVVQGVTGVISGITDAITPQEEELSAFSQYVEDVSTEIQETNEATKKAVEEAKGSFDAATMDSDAIGVLGDRLMELNSVEQLTTTQKAEMQAIVAELSKSIPELSGAYDDENGKLNKTNEELAALVKNYQNAAIAQAATAATQELVNAQMEATVSKVKAESLRDMLENEIAVWDAEAKLYQSMVNSGDYSNDNYRTEALKLWKEALDEGRISLDQYNEAVDDINTSNMDQRMSTMESKVGDLTGGIEEQNLAIKDSEKVIKDCGDEIGVITEAQSEMASEAAAATSKVNGLSEAMGRGMPTDVAEEMSGALSDVSDAYGETAEAAEDAADTEEDAAERAAEAAKAGTDAQKKALQGVREEFDALKDDIQQATDSKISLFDAFDGGDEMSLEDMQSNIASYADGIRQYYDDLETLSKDVGHGISQEFFQYLSDLGPEGANVIHEITEAWTSEGEDERKKVQDIMYQFLQSMDASEQGAEIQARNQTLINEAFRVDPPDSTQYDGLFDALNDAIAYEGAEVSSDVQAAFSGAVEAARKVGADIPDSIGQSISEGNVDAAIEALNGSVQGKLEGLAEVVRDAGVQIPDEITAGIQSGDTGAMAAAYDQLISAISENVDTSTLSKVIGDAVGEAAPEIEGHSDEVGTAAGNVAQAGADAAAEKQPEFKAAGDDAGTTYAEALRAHIAEAAQAAGALASAAQNAIASYRNAFENAGYNMSAGVAQGISNGANLAVNAAVNMMRQTLAAAKREPEIASPSKKFRREVGQQIANGVAFGIRDKASLAGSEATKMSAQVYSKATAWLSKYKKSHEVSLSDEKWYWQQIVQHTQEGTAAYNKAIGKMLTAGVSKTTGTGKNKKRKDAETYYGEVYSAANTYISNLKVLNDMSLEQELSYWTAVQSQLKQGTQAWYDATSQIKDLQAEIAEEAAAVNDRIVSAAEDAIRKQRITSGTSKEWELAYWEETIKNIEAGSDAWYDALEQIQDLKAEIAEEAAEVNDRIVSAAEDAIRKQRITSGTSKEWELAYWEETIKSIEAGSDAWYDALEQIQDLKKEITEEAASLAAAVNDRIVSAAEDAIRKRRITDGANSSYELAYWEEIIKSIESGSDAWYDAFERIKDLRESIAEETAKSAEEAGKAVREEAEAAEQAAKDAKKTHAAVQKSILDTYKTYYQVSARAEMDYWDIARRQFQEGTEERVEADQAYLEAREKYYDQLEELDKDYADKKQKVDDDLADSIKDLQDAYDDAVKSREKEIRSSMNLFEAWDAEGWDSGKLMANLKTQVEGLQFWEDQLDGLAKKGVTQELMDELAAMGPDAAANLWSLNQMTAEQLDEYQGLWTEKNNLAHKQALEDNKNLLKETQDSIADARKAAQDELAKMDEDYRKAVADLNVGLSDGLRGLVAEAGNIGEDMIAALVAAVTGGETDVSAAVARIVAQTQVQALAIEASVKAAVARQEKAQQAAQEAAAAAAQAAVQQALAAQAAAEAAAAQAEAQRQAEAQAAAQAAAQQAAQAEAQRQAEAQAAAQAAAQQAAQQAAAQQAAAQQAAAQAAAQQAAAQQAAAQQAAQQQAATLLGIINSGKQHAKSLTAAEKKDHHDLWKYLVKNYGRAPNESVYKNLADVLGIKVSGNVTSGKKDKILEELKKRGLATGTRNIWQDELAWILENAKTEYVVRTADNAILQPMRAGDKVINPKGAENLYDFAENPTKFISTRARDALAVAQEAMQKRQDEMRSQIPELSYGGITKLNRLMESGMQAAPTVNVDNKDLVSLMQQMVSGMQAIMGQMQDLQERQIVMDSGALVGALQQPMSRANAAVQRRRNRGTLR